MSRREQQSGEGEQLGSARLELIARRQKGILVCILLYLVCVIGQFLVPGSVRPFVRLAAILPIVGGTVFVFLLATKLYSTVLGVVLGVLTLVPIIGLLVLLIVNSRATRVLRDAGVSVGLLGADLSDISKVQGDVP